MNAAGSYEKQIREMIREVMDLSRKLKADALEREKIRASVLNARAIMRGLAADIAEIRGEVKKIALIRRIKENARTWK